MMNDQPEIRKLEEANQQLQNSLKTCHDLVAKYRAKLAANGNEPLFTDSDEGSALLVADLAGKN